jgi:hypothetical protein
MTDLLTNCVSWYKCDDAAANTTVIDTMGFSNGTASRNTDQLTCPGKINTALSFNGDYVDCNNTFVDTFKNSFTINAWFKLDAGGSLFGASYFSWPLTSYAVFLNISPNDNEIWARYASSGYCQVVHTYTFSTDWTMYTVTVQNINDNSAKITLYIDKVMQAASTNACVMKDYASDKSFIIGALNSTSKVVGFINGAIDNVLIFNKSLSQQEVDFLWCNGAGTDSLDTGTYAFDDMWAW